MQTTLSQVEKSEILNKRSNILCRVKKNTDIYLHPNSKNISNDKITQEIIFNTEVKQIDYYWVLSISPKTDYVIHLKRSTGSCFLKNHNPVLLKTWEANLDIQQVHNY